MVWAEAGGGRSRSGSGEGEASYCRSDRVRGASDSLLARPGSDGRERRWVRWDLKLSRSSALPVDRGRLVGGGGRGGGGVTETRGCSLGDSGDLTGSPIPLSIRALQISLLVFRN